ncbi:hypothetical protein KIN20_002239 [Parelaphostrongylus tenuis]|uniref:Uncharacterized protein n=1 Tax=Parelaphostrongylus tenuis TaxID=148309 RepID=A0AAD5LY65_PARTN|nr:hypothetical protein KIN20_002239 [Parelaphostrongylus tenuis]
MENDNDTNQNSIDMTFGALARVITSRLSAAARKKSAEATASVNRSTKHVRLCLRERDNEQPKGIMILLGKRLFLAGDRIRRLRTAAGGALYR